MKLLSQRPLAMCIKLIMLFQVSIIVVLFGSSGAIPYYVTPSDDIIADDDTCFFEGRPLRPCSTLETLAKSYSSVYHHHSRSGNFELFFFPGDYVLRNNMYLTFTSFQVSLSPLMDNGSPIKIKCNAEMTITFQHVTIAIIKSLEFYSCGGKNQEGHVLNFIRTEKIIQILNSAFIGNNNGSAIKATGCHSLTITKCRIEFIKNYKSKVTGRAAVYVYRLTTAIISDSIFENNLVRALSLRHHKMINITNCTFMNNTALERKIHLTFPTPDRVSTFLISCTFHANIAQRNGGAIEVFDGNITIANCTFLKNVATYIGGAIMNYGIRDITVINSTFVSNSCGKEGGAIAILYHRGYSSYTLEIKVKVELRNVTFRKNSAVDGGAISMRNTELYLHGYSKFIKNEAHFTGGALKLSKSKINFVGNLHKFENNSAGKKGGALFLSKSFLNIENNLSFTRNEALSGGAWYIQDSNDQCEKTVNPYYSCFFMLKTSRLYFKENVADNGPVLYGGLNTCSDREIRKFTNLSSFESVAHSLSSDVANICYCSDKKTYNCSNRFKNISAFRGESISLMIMSIDRYENFKPSVLRYCDDSTIILRERNCRHKIHTGCERLIFHTYSSNTSGVLIIKSAGLCGEINNIVLTVNISFQPCPRGFQLVPGGDRCDCDKRIDLDRKSSIQCHIDNQTIENWGSYWFRYLNRTLQVCKSCPFDYCDRNINFLPLADINDSQCNNNRSGVICGFCKDFFSIALGSSKCIECFNQKYNLLWLVPLFAVMGLLLVLIILFLDLTVSIGLINGLIFYANILSISGLTNTYNCSIHPLLSVFISWVNLDFGIETCFYSGMDMYQKTWLQFAFPLYIWLLVGLIIILSHYSTRVMRLLGRKVIPVLATLFLLSYAKILKIITTAFDSTEVLRGDADNTSDKLVPCKVWTYDGNVDYLSGKHIPLFIVALVFLVVVFLPYTLLLIFGQCLHSLPRRKGLKWLHSITFISIMDAYHAPFNRKHRYWAGFLLLMRCILLTVFVANHKQNGMTSNVFATALVTMGLIMLKASLDDRVYQNLLTNILENTFLLNLGILAATLYYVEGFDICKPILDASISVALVTFFLIIVCHIYYKMKHCKVLHNIMVFDTSIKTKVSIQNVPQQDMQIPTTTFTELRESLLEQ